MTTKEVIECLREIDRDWPHGYVFVMKDGRTLSLKEIIRALMQNEPR